MGALRRHARRSITTQIMVIVATIIVAISILIGLVAEVTNVAVLSRSSTLGDSPLAIASRIAYAARTVQAAKNDAVAEIILDAIRTSGVDILRVPLSSLEPAPKPTIWPGPLTKRLMSEPGIEVLDGFRFPQGPRVQTILRLNETDALVFDAATRASPWPFFFTSTAAVLAVALIFLVLLTVYAVRWIIAPLALVTDAALSFGRSPDDDRLIPNTGPREIAQVADALNDMRTRIRDLIADRTRMLAAISHDLRTPLTRMRLRAERVTDPPLREGMLKDLISVSRMLDETLRYLREDGKSEPMSRVDLPSLLQTVCSDFADVGHDVAYNGPGRLPWTLRPRSLTRAIVNIVDNSVKHGSRKTIRLRDEKAAAVTIEVADHGPGIPAELRGRVFEPFFKADEARAESGGGFGLGLSIAQEIVKRHGGEINLAQAKPTGLFVQIVLPAQNETPSPASEGTR
jgi:signal transduction histidine kinase